MQFQHQYQIENEIRASANPMKTFEVTTVLETQLYTKLDCCPKRRIDCNTLSGKLKATERIALLIAGPAVVAN